MFRMKFIVYTPESASPEAREALKSAQRGFGFVPNLLGVMAEAPIALRAYMELTDLRGKASLNAVEAEIGVDEPFCVTLSLSPAK
jgi:hypothetical protein